jgi:hypothetical protein
MTIWDQESVEALRLRDCSNYHHIQLTHTLSLPLSTTIPMNLIVSSALFLSGLYAHLSIRKRSLGEP